MSLLDKAKLFKPNTRKAPTEEEIELAIAWAQDEVTLTQVNKALNADSSTAYSVLARALRAAVKQDRLRLIHKSS